MDDIIILPLYTSLACRGFTVKTLDGYTIYINADLSDEAKKKTLQHELAHIHRGDLYSDSPGSVLR